MILPYATALVANGDVPLRAFVDDGMTKTHGIEPLLLPLTRRGGVQSLVLRVGERGFRIWIREEKGMLVLFADRNGDGKAGADERIDWSRTEGKLPDGSGVTGYQGIVELPLGGGDVARYGLRYLVSNTREPGFRTLRDKVQVVQAFGFTGKATFGGKVYRIAIRGGNPENAGLFVDRDGDGVMGTVEQELFPLGMPFNLGGKSYRLGSFKPFGHPSVSFVAARRPVEEIPMPPDLSVGKRLPPIVAPKLGGGKLNFPSAFRGKLVLMDVWATWCGPCKAEIPYLKEAYARFKSRGFEIASFSIDDKGMDAGVEAYLLRAGESWTQLFPSGGPKGPFCQKYDIAGIPFVLLIDGSTGKILARAVELRGPFLAPTVEWELRKRGR